MPARHHQYPYLMHAMLGVSGSHLDLQVDRPKIGLALTHRQKAISGLEKAFARWPPPAHEAHIMLATSYLLAFQAGYLADGLLDHVLAFRGCASLSKLILTSGMSGPFVVHANYHKMTNLIKCRHFLPRLDQAIASEALCSISRFSHLIAAPTTHAIDKALVAQLVEAVRALLETETQPSALPTEDSQTGTSDREASIPLSPPPPPADTPQDRNPDTSYLHILPDNPYLRIRDSPSVAADPVQAFANINWATIMTPPSPAPTPTALSTPSCQP
ncbi:hypothetical protein N0V83_000198 [Neocucurbitaria cava]|uniref:Uncharacterized protein n=1 Tax=Neocucurbitaria cava TaxID=798079 RepID=A0A9W8YH16_9PLEO|nr:hypothetical protein N0V83_000198 [Neocucurbitaria cava]